MQFYDFKFFFDGNKKRMFLSLFCVLCAAFVFHCIPPPKSAFTLSCHRNNHAYGEWSLVVDGPLVEKIGTFEPMNILRLDYGPCARVCSLPLHLGFIYNPLVVQASYQFEQFFGSDKYILVWDTLRMQGYLLLLWLLFVACVNL